MAGYVTYPGIGRSSSRKRQSSGHVNQAVLRHRAHRTFESSATDESPATETSETSDQAQPAPEAETGQLAVSDANNESDDSSGEAVTEVASLHTRRSFMPAPLLGSHLSLERQNDKTEADGLERIEDEGDLADRIARKMLVPLPASSALTVNANLIENHRYCRPWTARFLSDLARVHSALFHSPLEVNSAVRTVEYQKRLMETNGNAAAAEGDVASPHLTGATIDIAKQGLSRQEMGWMRSWLLTLQKAGKIDVEEEFQQACFHITVYKSYVPPKPVSKSAHKAVVPARPTQQTDTPSSATAG